MSVKQQGYPSREFLALAAGLLLVLLVFVVPATAAFTRVPGDLGDARFNSVVLEHVFRWLTGREAALWSPGFFYPYRDVLAFSDNHFGTVSFYAIARGMGLGRESAYLAWFSLGVLLNFGASYYVLRRFGFGALAAVCGALLFSAGLPTAFKIAHAQLTYRFAAPLAFWCLYIGLRGGGGRNLWLALGFTLWQFFCSIYLGVFLVYTLAFLVLACLIGKCNWHQTLEAIRGLRGGDGWQPLWLVLVVSVAAMVLGGMLYKYAAVGAVYGLGRSSAEIYPMLPMPGSYLISDQSMLYQWLGSAGTPPMRQEHQMFVGVFAGLLMLSGAGLALARSAPHIVRVAVLVLAGLVLFTMNFGGHSLYSLVIGLPGISSVRAVSRVVLLMLLPAAILVAWAVHRMAEGVAVRTNSVAAAIFGLVCIAGVAGEVLAVRHYNSPLAAWQAREAAVRAALPQSVEGDSVLLVTWGDHEPHKYLPEIDGMIVAQDRGIPTLNGYSGNLPSPAWLDAAWGAGCTSAGRRIDAIPPELLAKIGAGSRDELLRRVITVSPEECHPDRLVLDDLAPDLIRDITLGVRVSGKHAVVTVFNHSSLPFSSYTRLGPVRLSWRLLPDGSPSPATGWDTRVELGFSLKPGESREVHFELPDSTAPGLKRLEVSLVHEGVRWLHEHGMAIADSLVRE